jgi:hypothetical protein
VTPPVPHVLWFPEGKWARLMGHCDRANIGGGEKLILRTGGPSEENLREQVAGLLGEWMVWSVLLGQDDGFWLGREKQDEHPFVGVPGKDLEIGGRPFDVKTSRMRRSQNPFDYTLVMPESDWYDWTNYIQVMVPSEVEKPPQRYGYIVGWSPAIELRRGVLDRFRRKWDGSLDKWGGLRRYRSNSTLRDLRTIEGSRFAEVLTDQGGW